MFSGVSSPSLLVFKALATQGSLQSFPEDLEQCRHTTASHSERRASPSRHSYCFQPQSCSLEAVPVLTEH